MHRRFAQALRSLAFKEGELPSDKPILLQSAEEHAEDQNHTETEDDSWILQEDLERIKPSKQQSNHRLLWLAVVTCLILFLVLLVSLLVLSRKIGHGCKCSEQNGPQHLESQTPEKKFERKNTTSNSELLKYLQFLNETLKSTLNKRNDDLAELKSTVKRVTLSVENLHSAMKDVRAAMNGTKNDLAKLKRTVTTVENLHSAMKDVRAAVNGTKNDLAKLKRTVTTLELFNSSLNQVNSKLTRTSNDISKLYSTVTKLENYNSSLNEVKSKLDRSRIDLSELNSTVTKVKSTLDRRSKDVTDLKSTVTKVKSKSDRTSDDVSVLNCTVTKLDKAIQSNFSESCQNVTWNSAFEDCKLKSCCAANSREEIPLTAESCKELYNTNGSDANKAYRLRLGKNILPVYCHMTTLDGCGGGGWTLVMKMDGSKDTFHYNHVIWTNKLVYNPFSGSTGFDGHETMLPTYWETKFNRICLGMKSGNKFNFIAINMTACSLYSLIADGKYRPTSLNRDKWKSLLPSSASLQSNCNLEGFNALCTSFGPARTRARIGILGNEQDDCATCDSRIGFGTGGHPDHGNSCGNVARWGADNGDSNIKTMGYILVQ